MSESGKPHILIAGGGIAGLEAMMALRDQAGGRADITLSAPDPDFVYKPLIVGEPFSQQPAEQHALAPITEHFGATFIQQPVREVRPDMHEAVLGDGRTVSYDKLIACVGARPRPAFAGAEPLRLDGVRVPIDSALREAEADESGILAVVIPSGPSWPLPAYELALMAQRRSRELGTRVEIWIVTPEEAPLIVFGELASDAVASLLHARGIRTRTGVRVKRAEPGRLILAPGEEPMGFGRMICLPVLEGPALPGLPADAAGFLAIDDHARVRGVDDVYAAGDGTNFPVKHGGIGTQEADAAAEHIAAALGAEIEPQPFRPVIRGKLLTGDDSLHMQHDLTGGSGEGTASADVLWWPPRKVAGRYLSAWLNRGASETDFEPPLRAVDVEVAWPREWHKEPMALDPLGPMGFSR